MGYGSKVHVDTSTNHQVTAAFTDGGVGPGGRYSVRNTGGAPITITAPAGGGFHVPGDGSSFSLPAGQTATLSHLARQNFAVRIG